MFAMDAILKSPGLVKRAAKSTGIDAARLDWDPTAKRLWLSLRIHHEIKQVPLPTGTTLTIDQVIGLLFDGHELRSQSADAPAAIVPADLVAADPPPP